MISTKSSGMATFEKRSMPFLMPPSTMPATMAMKIVCDTRDEAEKLRDAINEFGEDAKIVERKGHPVVYLKEGEQIVTVLSVMGAYKALMELENIRIVKEMLQ